MFSLVDCCTTVINYSLYVSSLDLEYCFVETNVLHSFFREWILLLENGASITERLLGNSRAIYYPIAGKNC